jgi:hypothetical protein
MLAVPVIKGGIPPKEALVSIRCAKSPWQNRCKDDCSHPFEAANQYRGPMMLRVETEQLDGALICQLEGRFTGEGAEEVRRLVTRCDNKLELVVDLTDVMFIDALGEEVLLFVKRLGAQFVAETSYSRDVCERLELPFIGKRKSNMHEPVKSDGDGHRPLRR